MKNTPVAISVDALRVQPAIGNKRIVDLCVEGLVVAPDPLKMNLHATPPALRRALRRLSCANCASVFAAHLSNASRITPDSFAARSRQMLTASCVVSSVLIVVVLLWRGGGLLPPRPCCLLLLVALAVALCKTLA